MKGKRHWPSNPNAKRDAVAFGDAVFDARFEAGLTREELASQMGITETAVRRVERGEGNFSLARMHAFADALGLDLSLQIERRARRRAPR